MVIREFGKMNSRNHLFFQSICEPGFHFVPSVRKRMENCDFRLRRG